jgi:uncharacterized phage-like protein YoqJ
MHDPIGGSVAVTGHRVVPSADMGWYQSELRRVFERLSPSAVLSGMALGVDQEAADIALDMGLPLVAVVPFPGQGSEWDELDKKRYQALLARADRIVAVSDEPPVDRRGAVAKLLRRNEVLVEMAGTVVACWSGKKSGGTWYTIKASKGMGKPTVVVRPGLQTVIQRPLFPALPAQRR